MEKDPKKYYRQRINSLQEIISRVRGQLRMIAAGRLLSFLLIFPSLFVILPYRLVPGILLSITFLIVFLALIKFHLKKNNRYRHLRELLKINEQELASLEYQFLDFDPGNEFIDTNHAYSYDMDLFGEGSVFQFLNRTVTYKGRHLLAQLFRHETLDEAVIANRQQAVKELSDMPQLRHDFLAAGRINHEEGHENEAVHQWINQPLYYVHRPFFKVIAVALPIVTLGVIVTSVFVSSLVALAIVLYLTQLILVGTRLGHTSKNHQLISRHLEMLKKQHALLGYIEKEEFESAGLNRIRTLLVTGKESASAAIYSLTRIVSAFDNRLNILAALFLQGLLLWDIQCMIRLEKWKLRQGSMFGEWIKAIADFDACTSLAGYAFNHPAFIYPEFSSETVLSAKDLGHVLLPPGERVCNDFEIKAGGKFTVITGANMAGKSTFLRTVATNMILAMAGAPVCASEMVMKPTTLFSSMRTSDSLNKHESYFYAELRRLKELLDRLHEGEKPFIILDEILKGTNSVDKQKGSKAALKQILELHGTGIIATHDLELAAVEKQYPEKLRNMCFEIEIDRAEISFDYKLREGITTKMNALLLMQQMGIIRDQDL